MAAKPPAYQMYAADFDTDTAEWSNAEVGAYQRLINSEWINRSLPTDHERLARIVREPLEEFLKLWATIGGKFYENGHGRLYNRRLEEVRAQQAAWREKSSKGGKASAEKRWGGDTPPAEEDGRDNQDDNQKVTNDVSKEQPTPEPTEQPKGNTSVSGLQSLTSSPTPKKPNDSPEVPKAPQDLHPSKRLVLNYETGKMEGILPKDIVYLQEAYPACDVPAEIKEFTAYWYAQGVKKRKKNWWTALTNRLSFIQQRGGTKHGSETDRRTYDPLEKKIRESEVRLRGGGDKGPDADPAAS